MNRLMAMIYPELRELAHRRLRQNQPVTLLETTALVNESYLRFLKANRLDVPDRVHFLAYASQVMRSIIVDYVRNRSAQRRGGDHSSVPLDTDLADSMSASEDEILKVNEALDELSRVDARAARIVEMRYFGGLTEAEIGKLLELTERTVRREWRKAKLLLAAALDAK
jgi:RNA polymerase sigma factor (TIGR02999 family)